MAILSNHIAKVLANIGKTENSLEREVIFFQLRDILVKEGVPREIIRPGSNLRKSREKGGLGMRDSQIYDMATAICIKFAIYIDHKLPKLRTVNDLVSCIKNPYKGSNILK